MCGDCRAKLTPKDVSLRRYSIQRPSLILDHRFAVPVCERTSCCPVCRRHIQSEDRRLCFSNCHLDRGGDRMAWRGRRMVYNRRCQMSARHIRRPRRIRWKETVISRAADAGNDATFSSHQDGHKHGITTSGSELRRTV